tara:strand:- start:215 stop:1204 length:990 start_codon:yes stop_codon:yes gene_type:complete
VVIIKDKVYGEVDLTEPVLIELMASSPLVRLKGIDQNGVPGFVLKGGNTSRFEHCVGVMILLRLLGASVEEQIAGLLHDVPHTAFSHAIDWVFGQQEEQEFHEKFFEKLVLDSEIPSILLKHGFDVKKVIDPHKFSLLEKDAPDLCGDRVDYTFRDSLSWFGDEGKDVLGVIDSLENFEGEIVFNDAEAALVFARRYLVLDCEFWAGPWYMSGFYYLALAVKRGLEIGVILEEDLFLEDKEVYSKLKESGDGEILSALEMLPKCKDAKVVSEKTDIVYKSKVRFIDPKVLVDGELVRVSMLFPSFLLELEEHKKRFVLDRYLLVEGKGY